MSPRAAQSPGRRERQCRRGGLAAGSGQGPVGSLCPPCEVKGEVVVKVRGTAGSHGSEDMEKGWNLF